MRQTRSALRLGMVLKRGGGKSRWFMTAIICLLSISELALGCSESLSKITLISSEFTLISLFETSFSAGRRATGGG